MKKIGFVDLDTSHPRSFVNRINAIDGIKVTGVYDRARVRGKQETGSFCKDFDVEEFSSVIDLAETCDGVMVLSADWETHFEDIKIVMEAGKACYCDKPFFGRIQEVEDFLALAEKTKAPVLAGSGWRWNEKIEEVAGKIKKSQISDALLCAPNERFYYGIHIVEMTLGLFGSGIEWVEAKKFGDNPTVVSVRHKRGMTVRLLLETRPSMSRFNVFRADGVECSVKMDGDDVHNGICNNFIRIVKTGISPAAPEELVESVRIMFAIEESLITGKRAFPGKTSSLNEISSKEFMGNYIKNFT